MCMVRIIHLYDMKFPHTATVYVTIHVQHAQP